MKCLTHIADAILSDPELRETYYEQVMAQRAAVSEPPAVAGGPDREARMQALYERIGYNPEAHPALDERPAGTSDDVEVTADTAATLGDLQRLIVRQRMTKKAARERLREVGIR